MFHIRGLPWAAAGAGLLSLCGAMPLQAIPITVPNSSFELPAVADGSFTLGTSNGDTTSVTSWTLGLTAGDSGGVFNPVNSQYPGTSGAGTIPSTGSGLQAAFLNPFGAAGDTDTLTTTASLGTVAANTTYTLITALGERLDRTDTNYQLALLFGGTPFGVTNVPGGSIAPGAFSDFVSTFTTGASGGPIGQTIQVQLSSISTGNGGQGNFDNIRLDATPIATAPEPSSWALLMTGGFALAGRRLFRKKKAA